MNDTVSQAGEAALRAAAQARQPAATPRALRQILCLDDFEAPARRFLPRVGRACRRAKTTLHAASTAGRSSRIQKEYAPLRLLDRMARRLWSLPQPENQVFGVVVPGPFARRAP